MASVGLVFDLDGTLVDAFEDIAVAINRPLAALGLPLKDASEIRELVGEGAGKLIERCSAGAPPEKLPWIREEMMGWYFDHPADHAFVYDGIREMLEEFHARGISMGVLSNKPHPMTVKTCDELGLSRYFRVIQGEDANLGPRKPDPALLLNLCGRMGTDRNLLVGDGVPDGQVAQNAGLPFVACLWGTRDRHHLEPFAPVAFVERPTELAAALRDLVAPQ